MSEGRVVAGVSVSLALAMLVAFVWLQLARGVPSWDPGDGSMFDLADEMDDIVARYRPALADVAERLRGILR